MFEFIRNFFKVSYDENRRVASLLIGVIVLILTYLLAFYLIDPPAPKEHQLLAWLDSIKLESSDLPKYYLPKKKRSAAPERKVLFRFNPNLADSLTLKELGFSPWLIRNILKFRTKGGHFYIKTDLKKIYNFPNSFYKHLENYIALPDTFEKFDLNSADTLELRYIKGIGRTLSRRILKYRARLGGYQDDVQLKEIYGLSESVRKKLVVQSYIDTTKIKKINLNLADYQTLRSHPYINGREAQLIIQYRQQHGDYKQSEDLLAIKILTAEWLRRLRPYLNLK